MRRWRRACRGLRRLRAQAGGSSTSKARPLWTSPISFDLPPEPFVHHRLSAGSQPCFSMPKPDSAVDLALSRLNPDWHQPAAARKARPRDRLSPLHSSSDDQVAVLNRTDDSADGYREPRVLRWLATSAVPRGQNSRPSALFDRVHFPSLRVVRPDSGVEALSPLFSRLGTRSLCPVGYPLSSH